MVLGHVTQRVAAEDGEKVPISWPSILRRQVHFHGTGPAIRGRRPPAALIARWRKPIWTLAGDIRGHEDHAGIEEFWSRGAYRAKVETPEMVVGSVRALNASVTDAWALANQVGNLGEPLYRKQEPTGYSNLNSDWVNSAALLGRMNFAVQLTQNRVPGVKVAASPPAELIGSPDFQKR